MACEVRSVIEIPRGRREAAQDFPPVVSAELFQAVLGVRLIRQEVIDKNGVQAGPRRKLLRGQTLQEWEQDIEAFPTGGTNNDELVPMVRGGFELYCHALLLCS